MPAIALKDVASLDPETRKIVETYDQWVGDTVFARVMAHTPEVLKKFDDLYGTLLAGSVESEIKELARLRLARLNDCHY
ncbi:MAG: hypothetical protein V3T69_02465 [Acidiferrobacterales bacterium]|jgi:alkylhydroperoxidase family enzyme